MLLHDFLHLTYNYEDLINYLCDMQVIRREVMCPRCQQIVQLRYTSTSLVIQCTNHYYKQVRGRKRRRNICNFTISPLQGTWFSNSRLGIEKTCRFIGYFLMMRPPRQHFLEQQLQMSPRNVVDWTNFCREVLTNLQTNSCFTNKLLLYKQIEIVIFQLLAQWIKQESDVLGGRDVIVEVDEAKIGRRKYNRGRIIGGQWVFGAIERNSKRFFIVPVKDRTAQTLTRIIQEHIAPGTLIYSDSWKGYAPLKDRNYVHQTVNHSVNFVDPETGVHTQNIERLWRDMRSALPRFGVREEHYENYLAEFIFKKRYDFNERIPQFFRLMASLYRLNNVLANNE